MKDVAVITGAGRGIGRAIAKAFAMNGTAVALVARSNEELNDAANEIHALGGSATPFPLDIRDADSVFQTIETIEQSIGPIDVLVNNAGVLGPIGPFTENDFNDWWSAVEINLRGAAFCMHAVLQKMMARYCGRVINICSGGANSAIAHFSSYIMAKTALVRLTECVANEMRPLGISIFAVNPGTVRTKMAEHSLNSPEGQKWLPWFREIFENGLDLPAESVAEFIVQLASGKADPLSGHFLHAGDDLDSMLAMKETIQQEKLYTLRLRTYSTPSNRSIFTSIREASEIGAGIFLRIEHCFPATRERIFKMWMDPEAIQQWFITPNLFGTYIEMKYPEKLSFTWQCDENTPTIINIDFHENGQRTNLVLTHSRFPNEEARNAHELGWKRCFDGIAKLLEIP